MCCPGSGALLLRVAAFRSISGFLHEPESRWRSLERLLSWDFDKLIIAHGPCVEPDAKEFVEEAFWWLKREV